MFRFFATRTIPSARLRTSSAALSTSLTCHTMVSADARKFRPSREVDLLRCTVKQPEGQALSSSAINSLTACGVMPERCAGRAMQVGDADKRFNLP